MSASVDIQTQTAYNTLSVPIQAVTTREEESDTLSQGDDRALAGNRGSERVQEYVFVLKEGKVILTAVSSGIQDSNFIEIQSGLEQGDEVVTGPFRAISRTLKDGDAVRKVSRQELFGTE